jgi:hypothetical protein
MRLEYVAAAVLAASGCWQAHLAGFGYAHAIQAGRRALRIAVFRSIASGLMCAGALWFTARGGN